MLKPGKTYDAVYNTFKWQIPEFYNIGVDICDKWADQGNRLAAHEYPREIEFVNELPMTATGKIMRKDLKKFEVERKTKV